MARRKKASVLARAAKPAKVARKRAAAAGGDGHDGGTPRASHVVFSSSDDSDGGDMMTRDAVAERPKKRPRAGPGPDDEDGTGSDDGFIKLGHLSPSFGRSSRSGPPSRASSVRSRASAWSDDDEASASTTGGGLHRSATDPRHNRSFSRESMHGDGDAPLLATAPWRRFTPSGGVGFRSLPARSLMLRLHEEVLSLAGLLRPTPEETSAANKLKERVVKLVTGMWASAEVRQFGSRSTGLELPQSDVDLVVFGVSAKRGLHRLGAAIGRGQFADHLEVIARARVPIVKFRDRESRLYVDVCFEQESGIRTAERVNEAFRQQPMLRPLVIVLKYFLLQRELNETYTGGVGSFLLLLMAMRVLQVCNRDGARGALELDPSLGETANGADTNGEGHKRRKKKKKKKKQKQRDSSGPEAVAARAAEISKESGTNLGMLLLAFLELYGHSLNFVKTGLSVQGNGCFYSKRDRQWFDPGRPWLLSVENPDNPAIDVGKNAYGIVRVRKAFDHARRRLLGAIQERTSHQSRYGSKPRPPASLLGCVVTMDAFLSARAAQLRERAGHASEFGPVPIRRPAYFYREAGDSDNTGSGSDNDALLEEAGGPRRLLQGEAAVGAGSAPADTAIDEVTGGCGEGVHVPRTSAAQPTVVKTSASQHGTASTPSGADEGGAGSSVTADAGGGQSDAGMNVADVLPATDATAPNARHNITLRRPRLIADLMTRTARLKRIEAEAEAEAAAAAAVGKPAFHWP